ncbi:Transporter [Planctomycetales bacterium 10988]|nr:Transporter [Planctomycetales bacterium 10988]
MQGSKRNQRALGVLGMLLCMLGCHLGKDPPNLSHQKSGPYRTVSTTIDYPVACTTRRPEITGAMPPRTVRDPFEGDIWDLSLEEAIQIALANSKSFRDLGGSLVSAPQLVGTVYEPALQESNPLNGVEAALSAFDANLDSSIFWERQERIQNFFIPGFGVSSAVVEAAAFDAQLSKRTATGGTFAVTNNVTYTGNNNPANRFPSAYDVDYAITASHPLLRGNGLLVNRVVGPITPNTLAPGPGQFNGVLISRINTDITLTDFEGGVRDFVSDVENAYWDLLFAYRSLEANVAARDSALATWRNIAAKKEIGARGGEADREAQARAQYFLFLSQVQSSLSGTRGGSTITNPGSGAGTLAGAGGVFAREANLRFLMGLPPNDGRLIRPSDEPKLAQIQFDWNHLVQESLIRRVELRRQRWVIRQYELQLAAVKTFLLPSLDATGTYRWRGFGDDLIDPERSTPLNSAYQNLTTGDLQEWQLGLNFSMPIGFRQANAAVRNAQLQLTRARAVHADQELNILHNLSGSVRDLELAYQQSQTNFNRRLATALQVEAVEDQYDAGVLTLDVLLEAQRDRADAEIAFYRSLIDYQLAIKAVHYEKGTFLGYAGVFLSEGHWPKQAYKDAIELSKHFRKRHLDYMVEQGPITTKGRAPQGLPQEAWPSAEQVPTPAPLRDQALEAIEEVPPVPPEESSPSTTVRTTPAPVENPATPAVPTPSPSSEDALPFAGELKEDLPPAQDSEDMPQEQPQSSPERFVPRESDPEPNSPEPSTETPGEGAQSQNLRLQIGHLPVVRPVSAKTFPTQKVAGNQSLHLREIRSVK